MSKGQSLITQRELRQLSRNQSPARFAVHPERAYARNSTGQRRTTLLEDLAGQSRANICFAARSARLTMTRIRRISAKVTKKTGGPTDHRS